MIQDLPAGLIEAVKKKLKEDDKEKDADKDKEDKDEKDGKKKGEKIDVNPQISDPYSPTTVRSQ